jgi:hypothetical protein
MTDCSLTCLRREQPKAAHPDAAFMQDEDKFRDNLQPAQD